MTPQVLIAGVSVRGMAESAVRAGYAVIAIDAYADLDLVAIADTRPVAPYSAQAAATTAATVTTATRATRATRATTVGEGAPTRRPIQRPDDHERAARRDDAGRVAVCYVSNFENHLDALRQLTRGRHLWGNSPATLAAARAPRAWAQALADAGIPVPRLRESAPRSGTIDARGRWLIKPRRSGGGHGIRPWRSGISVSRDCVLQERITGAAGSIAFAADGRQSIPIAVTRQLIGERALGAPPFRYCGNILAPADDPMWGHDTPLWHAAVVTAEVATRAFGLVGVNGIDFIARRGRPIPIEINPRFTAAMELAERRDGISIFAAHVAGCTHALATYGPLATPSRGSGAVGKAIVFARHALTVGPATPDWLADPDVRDIPRPGTHIPRGAPICSVFAVADTGVECQAQLLRRANRIYEATERSEWRLVVGG